MPGLDDVENGLVISDEANDTANKGNQFVWVPVSKENFETEFVRHDYSNAGIKDENFVTDKATEENEYYEPSLKTTDTKYATAETLNEVKRMYESVKENGGFYIGRYEAGTTDTNTNGTGIRGEMVCKKGATVYNNIGWSNSNEMKNEEGGAVKVAREFAEKKGYTSVKSTLCYGVQWDAVMRWISNSSDEQYLKDSTGKGDYSRSDPAKTGSNENYQMKNVYDMAGNVLEWTMECERQRN